MKQNGDRSVLEDAGGVSSGFQDQNTFGIALWFRCCRFFAVHTTNFTTMIRMLPGDAAAQCFRSKNFQLCYSVHMLRSEKQLVRRSPASVSVSQLNIIEKNK